MAILVAGKPVELSARPTLDTEPSSTADLTTLAGPEYRAELLRDYSFTIFWAFATFVHRIEDLVWHRDRINDPGLADHPLLSQARWDKDALQDEAVLDCHGLVSDESQASRLWTSLSPAERALERCDEAWDVEADREDLIGVIWDTWAPGQFPESWSLRSFLLLRENERPGYAEYQRRGIIDTPVMVGVSGAQARARDIRKQKFANASRRTHDHNGNTHRRS